MAESFRTKLCFYVPEVTRILVESTDPPATTRVAAYLQAGRRARPDNYTEEDILLELPA